MKKFIRIVGVLLILFLLTLLSLAGFVWFRSNSKLKQHYTVTLPPLKIPADAAAVERGKHLAITRGCTDCHGPDLAGLKVMENGAMGTIYGSNITHGQGGLPASFRDEDYERAIRHGIGADGRGLFLMPSTDYALFSEEDMGALIAYLKSVPPVNRPTVPIALGPVSRALLTFGKIKLAADEIDHANIKPSVIAPGVTVEYGRYVANSCTGCHGANFSGGKIASGPPDWPPAANLTPHASGHLAKWSEADFTKSLREAKRPDGTELHPAMPRAFGQMHDMEIQALWTYFKTLPSAPTGQRS
ncbi:MAG: hypothetical protein RL693_2154 [Verrucomicrobiota bacterium]|jgi:cytochrome c553